MDAIKITYTPDEEAQRVTALKVAKDPKAKISAKYQANTILSRIERDARKRAEVEQPKRQYHKKEEVAEVKPEVIVAPRRSSKRQEAEEVRVRSFLAEIGVL